MISFVLMVWNVVGLLSGEVVELLKRFSGRR